MMLVPERHAVVLTLRNLDRVTTLIPRHQRVNEHTLSVKHGVEETKILRNLGIDVPSPVLSHYDWPRKYPSVFDHQRETTAFLTLHKRCFVFNDMGTGKSLSSLWAADYLMKEKLVRKALILSTMTCMETVWQNELWNNIMHRTSIVVHGSATRRKLALQEDVDFYILNHDGIRVPGIVEAILERGDIDLIIVDEASYLRNSRTKSYSQFKKLLKPQHWLWMLTGQPCPNGPEDAFGLGHLVSPDRLPKYFTRWQAETMVKINQFKWVAKPDAMKRVYEVLQPAIRFSKEDCLDLPPVVYLNRGTALSVEQDKAYRTMKEHLRISQKGEAITAVNAAVKLGKLLQICCLAYNTPVLTQRGWVPIQNVLFTDLVWDGLEWVRHGGVVYNGDRQVLQCEGVWMTPDHEVLTDQGWHTAKDINGESGKGLKRADVRLPNRYGSGRHINWAFQKSHVVLPMHLWPYCRQGEPEPTQSASPQRPPLWLSTWRAHQNAWYVANKTLSNMGSYAASMYRPYRQGLEELRRAWHHGVRRVAGIIRIILGRHAGGLHTAANTGANQQRQGIRTEQLQVGNYGAAGSQSSSQQVNSNTTRHADYLGSSPQVQNKQRNAFLSSEYGVASGEGIASTYRNSPTFDIVNAGPRHRFVVQGEDGQALIVHNCGCVHTDVDTYAPLDTSPRLAALLEAIAEANAKVIVFVPYTGALWQVAQHLEDAGITVGVVDGSVTGGKRTTVLNAFTRETDPHVLVANPATAAHGLNLTVADCIIWFSPIHSLDVYRQACERCNRPGQKNSVRIIHLGATPLEWGVYRTVAGKDRDQQSLLDLYKQEMGGVETI